MISKTVLSPAYIIVRLWCLITFLIVSVLAKNSINDDYKMLEILNDLPMKNDLEHYLIKLEKIIGFANKYKLYVDLNFVFGLFLVDVNLRRILKMKGEHLPKTFEVRLYQVLNLNDNVLEFYQNMLQKDEDDSVASKRLRDISNLFFNSKKSWIDNLPKFRSKLLKKTNFQTWEQLLKKYSSWSQYYDKIFNFENYIPDPETSDYCISKLVRNPINTEVYWFHCKIPKFCEQSIMNGTNFGYSMTHRLLYLLLARFSRGCAVTLGSQDKIHIEKLCSNIYKEAEYLAYNNFQIPDLFLEQISLCTLEGHIQFLRRSWLKELFGYQSDLGCVGTKKYSHGLYKDSKVLYKMDRPEWRLSNDNQEIMGDMCNTHTTGLAAAVLAAAIRYIMETFY